MYTAITSSTLTHLIITCEIKFPICQNKESCLVLKYKLKTVFLALGQSHSGSVLKYFKWTIITRAENLWSFNTRLYITKWKCLNVGKDLKYLNIYTKIHFKCTRTPELWHRNKMFFVCICFRNEGEKFS